MESGDSAVGFEARTVQRPRQQVEEQLRSAILNGVLKTGAKLPTEVALAQDFGVSRSTVREALRALVVDGLIEKVPGAGGGSFVRTLDHEAFGDELGQDVEKLLRAGVIDAAEPAELRRLVEVACAGLAASRRSATDLEDLVAAVARREVLEVDDPRIGDLDERFHELIGRAAGNRLAAALIRGLRRVTEPVGRLSESASRQAGVAARQAVILDAVRARDVTGARSAMAEHLSYLGGSGE